MFRRFPIFQRLISWTKPYSPAERRTREYARYDWNSLVADDPEHRALVADEMDGTSYFPSRPEVEAGLAAFAERAGVVARYGCRWESTRKDEDGFILTTSDGDYRAQVLVFATGIDKPWKPSIPGIEQVPHYVETGNPKDFAGRRVFIIGKGNSAFEVADGLLPWAERIILASPRPARLSVMIRSIAGARARYMQTYEDHVLGGGNIVFDASIERVERAENGYRVHTKGTTNPGDVVFEVDNVIAATGFSSPLRDLPELGVTTFSHGRIPAQTPYWESQSLPGIYFAGSLSLGAGGLRKYGIPSSSGSLHGFRHNARVLARHLAEKHFGLEPARRRIPPDEVVGFLLSEATLSPELWNQKAYLARVLELKDGNPIDEGVVPLQHFVDSPGPEAVAMTVEMDAAGDIHPVAYVRRMRDVTEHALPPSQLGDYRDESYRSELSSLLRGLVRT
jgi:thioredoxin reductase